MSSSVSGVGGTETMYRKHYKAVRFLHRMLGVINHILQDSADTSAAAYKLFRGGNKSRLPFRSRAAFASPEKRPLRRVRENRIYHTKYQSRTKVLAPKSSD
jgi:hypothetical protein